MDTHRIRIQIRYDGTGYSGWQRQRDRSSVQGEVERAVAELTGSFVPVYASGRTDAGVHAIGQVAHFDTNTTVPMGSLPRALNSKLPKDIAIWGATRVDDAFHARFSVRRKTYVYRIFVSPERDPIRERFAFRVTRRPDVLAMRVAAAALVGEHDFRSFVTGASEAEAEKKSMVRRLSALRVLARGDTILIVASAGGFLQHMVRNLAGFLLKVGDGRLPAASAGAVLAARARADAPAALTAAGLFLWRVDY